MSSISMIFLNWKRRDNLSIILDKVKKQTELPSIYVIDNSFTDPNNKITTDETINYIPSDNSLQCWSRWNLSKDISSKYICVMDDDLIFTDDNVLEICKNYLDLNVYVDAVGYAGVLDDGNNNYWRSTHLHIPTDVDTNVKVIKGRFMFIRKESLITLDMTPDFTCDDIKVSSHLRNKVLLSDLRGKFTNMSEGEEAVHRQPQQHQRRLDAMHKYFKK